MPGLSQRAAEKELARLHRVKQSPAVPVPLLGPELIAFFKTSVQKRQTKFAAVAQNWQLRVPPMLNDHCALEGFSRGTLTVLVDSASHLYELKQLLLAGIQKQLLLACKGAGLRKIALKPGRWYEGMSTGDRKIKFE